MRTRLKLFLKWGITFEEPYEIEEKSAREVAYADKQEIEQEIVRRYMCCVEEEPDYAVVILVSQVISNEEVSKWIIKVCI